MLYFWWGSRRNFKLITLGCERVNVIPQVAQARHAIHTLCYGNTGHKDLYMGRTQPRSQRDPGKTVDWRWITKRYVRFFTTTLLTVLQWLFLGFLWGLAMPTFTRPCSQQALLAQGRRWEGGLVQTLCVNWQLKAAHHSTFRAFVLFQRFVIFHS